MTVCLHTARMRPLPQSARQHLRMAVPTFPPAIGCRQLRQRYVYQLDPTASHCDWIGDWIQHLIFRGAPLSLAYLNIDFAGPPWCAPCSAPCSLLGVLSPQCPVVVLPSTECTTTVIQTRYSLVAITHAKA